MAEIQSLSICCPGIKCIKATVIKYIEEQKNHD